MSVKSPLSRGDGTHSPPKRIVVGRSEQENFAAADQCCVPGARRNTYTYMWKTPCLNISILNIILRVDCTVHD